MKPQRIKLTKSQMIDGEWSTTEALCLGEALTEDMSRLRFQNDDEDLLLTFGPQEVAIKTYTSDGSSQALLRLHQTTTGRFVQHDYVIEFAFILNAMHREGLSLFIQYDIYQNGEKIAENSLRTEVIEA